VIGTGASAMQIVPAIAPQAAHLTVFQRGRHWALPNPLYHRAVSDERSSCSATCRTTARGTGSS
jgi:cation diffusion facilitator CzcD-associated flavoprotein CzcO